MITGTSYTPPVTRTTFRRSLVMAAVAGVLGIAVLGSLGYWAAALCGLVGLGLGALNSLLVFRSVIRFAVHKPSKARFSQSVLGRLGLITALAFGCAVLFRPAGIAVFGGLALFQLLAIVSSMLPLIKEIRQK